MKTDNNKQTESPKIKQIKEEVYQVLNKYRETLTFAGGYLAKVTNPTVLDIERDLKELWDERS